MKPYILPILLLAMTALPASARQCHSKPRPPKQEQPRPRHDRKERDNRRSERDDKRSDESNGLFPSNGYDPSSSPSAPAYIQEKDPGSDKLSINGTVYDIDGGNGGALDAEEYEDPQASPSRESEQDQEMSLKDAIREGLGSDRAKTNAFGRLVDEMKDHPEVLDRLNRWGTAREHARQVREQQEAARETRRTLQDAAQKMRDDAMKMRTEARNSSDPAVRQALERVAEGMDATSSQLERGATQTTEQRQADREARQNADKAEREAAKGVDPAIRNLLDEVEHEQQNRPAQQRVDLPE